MSNDINRFVRVLKKHTNRASKTLYNASSLEVVIAMTMITRKGNEAYLEAYNEWLNKEVNLLSKDLPKKIGSLKNRPTEKIVLDTNS
jgi:hypothetical protein